MIPETLQQTEGKMQKTVAALERDLGAIRTGRASPTLVEGLVVDYYGTMTPIKQLGTISVPEARMIAIQAWDKGAVTSIEKAILKSELGLTPSTEGALIRLRIPQLTAERRKDLIKIVHKRVEEGKIGVRNERRDAIEKLRAAEKNKEISQDDQKRAETQLQKLTDTYVAKADKAGAAKEAELMEV